MIVFLVGRRGSGKTTLAEALAPHGFLRIHSTAIAREIGLQKDELGAYVGLAHPLRTAIAQHLGPLVIDGSPRTIEQRTVLLELSRTRGTLLVELTASEALSRARMASRGDSQRSVDRAQIRWEMVEEPAIAGLERLCIDALSPTHEQLALVLSHLRPLRAR